MLLKIAVVIALATILSAAFGAPQSNQLASQWAQGAASGNSPVGKVHTNILHTYRREINKML